MNDSNRLPPFLGNLIGVSDRCVPRSCQRWLGAAEKLPVGSKAATVLETLGNPTTIHKYRASAGEVEEWVYSNLECAVRMDVVGYRVKNVYTSNR